MRFRIDPAPLNTLWIVVVLRQRYVYINTGIYVSYVPSDEMGCGSLSSHTEHIAKIIKTVILFLCTRVCYTYKVRTCISTDHCVLHHAYTLAHTHTYTNTHNDIDLCAVQFSISKKKMLVNSDCH
jgi:hypothetical protein